jgi:hypothetical protein
MKITIPVLILGFLLVCLNVFADNDKYAPLPDKIVTAKTVFLTNETGKARFGDAQYEQLNGCGEVRWKATNERRRQ